MDKQLKTAYTNRIPLAVFILVFIACKLQALSYPFFWDESWSYAPAVRLMTQHGPSMMPDAIDTFYSRGHPLLFYFLASSWSSLFGTSFVAHHAFALCISVLLIISIFEVCIRLFNVYVAYLATLFFGLQVIFFIQSTLVLPEVMLALFAVLALGTYALGNYWGTLLSLTALFFTKESGLTLGLVLGMHCIISLLDKDIPTKTKWLRIASVCLPTLLIGLFFVLQKKIHGWYFYPEHVAFVDWSKNLFKGKLRYFLEIILVQQYRIWVFCLVPLLSLSLLLSRKRLREGWILAFAPTLGVFISDNFGWISRKIYTPLLFCYMIGLVIHYTRGQQIAKSKQATFLLLGIAFSIVYMGFYAANFFSVRYLLAAMAPFCIFFAYIVDWYASQFSSKFGNITRYSAVCLVLLTALVAFKNSDTVGDTDLPIYHAMKVQQSLIGYLERNNLYNAEIAASGFLQREHLQKPLTGFRSTIDSFHIVLPSITPTTTIVLWDNIEPDSLINKKAADSAFQVVYSVAHGAVRGCIYQRVQR
jgi:4-amino-4-deoxy-L-arabinose transferase-like glycosyltransferase